MAIDTELLRAVDDHLDALARELRGSGFGGRVGFGSHPAILVIDFVRAFTDPGSPLGADLDSPVAATARLLSAAHAADTPVVFSIPLREAGRWSEKIPSNDLLVESSGWVTLDERLGAVPSDAILPKRYASCFFGTDLVTRLVSRGVDTLLIAGCSTSGCVRASVVDACSLGFRASVVAEAVGDRAPLSHRTTLFDIDAKYGDVVSLADAVTYLETLR